MNKNNLFIPFLLTTISLIWAGSFIVVKLTVGNNSISPIGLAFIRFLIATPFMILIMLLRKKEKKLPLKELPSLFVLGLSGVTLIYVFQYLGIYLSNASTSAVLINTNVIFIVILSLIFLKEKMSFYKIIGITFSFVGVIIVVIAQSINTKIDFSEMFFIGCIFVILSAFCWAIYTITGKKLLEKYDEITITTYAFILGTLFFLPLVFREIPGIFFKIDFNILLAVLYLSLLCAVFGYIGWYYALKKSDASKSAVFLNFIPLFAIMMSFFLGESLSGIFILGASLIILGVYLTQKG